MDNIEIVPDEMTEEKATSEYGEYGTNWIYESDVVAGADTTDEDGSETDADDPLDGPQDDAVDNGAGEQDEDSSDDDGDPGDDDQQGDSEEQSPEEESPEEQDVIDPTDGMSPKQTAFYHQLVNYKNSMAPNRPTNSTEGASAHRSLFFIITAILKLDDEDFVPCMDMLMSFYNDNSKGSFSVRSLNRFHEEVRVTHAQLELFRAYNRLFTLTADPAQRQQNIKHFDMSRLVKLIGDPKQENNILGYFKVQ